MISCVIPLPSPPISTLSDREIRTLLASLHDLPLHYSIVHEFHQLVKNCSASHHTKTIPTPVYERYADSDLVSFNVPSIVAIIYIFLYIKVNP